jgi:catechol 2,3-dioxygenase-like lactoylglutathione lyase family enzyme
VNPHVSIITLGVRDFARAKRFYVEQLGWPVAYNVRSEKRVDEVLAEAEQAGASIVKQPEHTVWGGYSGYFADPEGYLWEVAAGATKLPFAE